MFSQFLSLLTVLYLSKLTSCANILVIDPMGSPSHHVWMRTLSHGLVREGHNVTSLSSYVEATADVPENLHYLYLEEVASALYGGDNDCLGMNQMNLWQFFHAFMDYFEVNERAARESKGFQRLLDYPRDFPFDLIIIDILATPGVYIFVDKFPNAPVITASGSPVPFAANRLSGVPNSFSFIPHELINTPMEGWLDRLTSFLVYVADELYHKFKFLPAVEKELKRLLPGMRPLPELMRLPKLHLVNYNPLIDDAQPMMPNAIAVGGLQIEEPQALPDNFQNIYNDPGSMGVVIFSLGTNIKAENLGNVTISNILRTFGEFPEFNFIWKINLTRLDVETPKNVFVRDWLPQNDLLAQEKTRLFISHAGGLSTQETNWYGVPMLCAPGFFDQFPNCAKAVRAGIAKKVELPAIGTAVLKDTLQEMLSNPIYRDNAQKRSQLFRDQPDKPIGRALWWVDYVLRNPNISHLQNPRLHEMNFVIKHSIDIIGGLVLLLVILMSLLFKVISVVVCLKWGKKGDGKFKLQ